MKTNPELDRRWRMGEAIRQYMNGDHGSALDKVKTVQDVAEVGTLMFLEGSPVSVATPDIPAFVSAAYQMLRAISQEKP